MFSFVLGLCSAFGASADVAVDAVKKVMAEMQQEDWVQYYGHPASTRNYAPVVVIPGMQWAVPNNCTGGPPPGPTGPDAQTGGIVKPAMTWAVPNDQTGPPAGPTGPGPQMLVVPDLQNQK